MWITAVNLSLFTAGQQVAKYNSIGATVTNFPSPLTYFPTGNSRPGDLNASDFIPIICGVHPPWGAILNVMSHLHCQR